MEFLTFIFSWIYQRRFALRRNHISALAISTLGCVFSPASLADNFGTGTFPNGYLVESNTYVGSARLSDGTVVEDISSWIIQSIEMPSNVASLNSISVVADFTGKFSFVVNGVSIRTSSQYTFSDWSWRIFDLQGVVPSETLIIEIRPLDGFDSGGSGIALASGNNSFAPAIQYDKAVDSDIDPITGNLINERIVRERSWSLNAPIVFDISYNPISAIPEPETYAMMLAGLGLVGVAARRRTLAKV